VFAEEKFRRAAMAYESLMSSLTSLTWAEIVTLMML
jgi:hypothetical protein